MKIKMLFLILICSFALVASCEDSNDKTTIDGDIEETDSENSENEDDTEAEAEAEEEIAAYKKLPVALCDMPKYELLDPKTLGDYSEFEELIEFRLEKDTINDMIADTGYKALAIGKYDTRVFRYRYTTQDKGRKVEATGLMSIPVAPKGETAPESFPYALWLHGTTGFDDPCAPSRAFDGGLQVVIMSTLGFIGVAPDYIGMTGFGAPSDTTHAYLVGEQIGIGVWDAMRAADKILASELSDTGVKNKKDAIVWGGSQGGHAALFAELYAPYYAPEYDVKAVVAAVPPVAMFALASKSLQEEGPGVANLMSMMAAMKNWYGAPDNYDGVFVDVEPYNIKTNIEKYMFSKKKCGDYPEGIDVPTSVTQLYDEEFVKKTIEGKWDELKPYDCYVKNSELASTVVKPKRYTPTLMVFSENDELVLMDTQRDMFNTLCDQGYQMEYLECQDAKHTEGAVWSLGTQIQWLYDRLDGKPIDSEKLCKRSEKLCCEASPEKVCTP